MLRPASAVLVHILLAVLLPAMAQGDDGSSRSPPAGNPEASDSLPAVVSPSLRATLMGGFPTLGHSLAIVSAFSPVSWEIDGRLIQGFRPYPVPGTPTDLRPEERAALLALAGQEAPVLTMFFARAYSDGCAVRSGGLNVWSHPLGSAPAMAIEDHGLLVYRGAYHGADVIHAISAERSEEFIHLANATAPTRFDYELGSPDGDLWVQADRGGLRLSDADGHEVRIEAPWVVDATGRKSSAATRWEVDTEQSHGHWHVSLHLDPEGLAYPLVIDPTWSATGSLSIARASHTATLLPSGKVLVTGGWVTYNATSASCELYDPVSGLWTTTGSMAVRRSGHAATLLPSGEVLVSGGSDWGAGLDGIQASCELYDPITGVWKATGSMLSEHSGHAAVLLPTGEVLVTGGQDRSSAYLSVSEVYDPLTGTWLPTAPLGTGRVGHHMLLLSTGKVLAIGGDTTNAVSLTSCELYDPVAQS
jgi:hypothetical protein